MRKSCAGRAHPVCHTPPTYVQRTGLSSRCAPIESEHIHGTHLSCLVFMNIQVASI